VTGLMLNSSPMDGTSARRRPRPQWGPPMTRRDAAMSLDHHSVHIELRFDGSAPTGNVRMADGEPRSFSGWVGLVCAVEELVTEDPSTRRAPPESSFG
jgi:hypothetical protein